jgi:oligopeptide transport system permease protein
VNPTLKTVLKSILLGLLTIVGIFFLSNVSKAFINQDPELIKVFHLTDVKLSAVTARFPETSIVDEKNNIVRVPYGKTAEYAEKLAKVPGILKISPVAIQPAISWKNYWFSIKDQWQHDLHGDFGKIRLTSNNQDLPFFKSLLDMLKHTCTYLFPGLLLAIALSVFLSLIAALWRWAGKLLDGIHVLLVGLPDFFLIVLIQLAAIYLSKFTDKRLVLIVQIGNQIPFLIPFLTIALVPGVLIYGTMRIAIQREMTQDYVVTAYAKGLSKTRVLLVHVFRNVLEDLLTVLPKATTIALASMAVAEIICNIFGLGGCLVNPKYQSINSMPLACMALALFAVGFHALYAVLRKSFVVHTHEAA